MKTKKEIKKNKIKNSLFVKSFKELDKKLIYTIILDILFYVVLLGIVVFTFASLKWNFEAVKEAIPTLTYILGDVENIATEDAAQKLTELNAAFFIAIARTILILLVIFIVSLMAGIFFKALIWTRILHKKLDIHFYRRFTLLNMLWIVPWALAIVILLFAIKSMFVFFYIILIIFLFLHFTNILYVLFEKKKKFSIILKETFMLGTGKIHHFILPYVWVALLFFLLVNILGLLSFLPWRIYVMLFILALFLYFAWVRIYISKIISNLAKIS